MHAHMLACSLSRFENASTMNPAPASDMPQSDDRSVVQEKIPLQVRLAREDIRAIKIAAAEIEQTISDFLLGCSRCWQAKTAASSTAPSKPQR